MIIEDLTRMVISYELTASVGFCLSHLNWDLTIKLGFYRLQNDHYFKTKRIVDTDVVNDVT